MIALMNDAYFLAVYSVIISCTGHKNCTLLIGTITLQNYATLW